MCLSCGKTWHLRYQFLDLHLEVKKYLGLGVGRGRGGRGGRAERGHGG